LVPLHTVLSLAPTTAPSWYFVPYYPGWALIAPVQIILAALLLWRQTWSRYAVIALVVALLLVQMSQSFAPQFTAFPLGAAREAIVVALHIATVVLLFLPSANMWFSKRGKNGEA
jgi:hypothetical protein